MPAWDELPVEMRTEAVRPYYESLKKKEGALCAKRMMDVGVSVFLLLLLFPVMIGLAVAIRLQDGGPAFFCQERVTAFGKRFTIYKFRTMCENAQSMGASVTGEGDERVTKIGAFLRKYRLDELPQLINILLGDMSLVGVRPEVPEYVDEYREEWMATLLLPAGVTSETSIRYRDEDKRMGEVSGEEASRVYVEEVLPEKMAYNLRYVKDYSIWTDIRLCVMTVVRVFTD